jgi:hypothetical protein
VEALAAARASAGAFEDSKKGGRMLRSVVAIAGGALLLGAVAARPARAMADDEVIRAHIPFAFNVEGQRMPAGDYVLKCMGINEPSVVEIRNANGSGPAALFLTNREDSGNITQPKMVFDDVGHQRFLRDILVPNQTGAEVPLAPAEVQAVLRHAEAHRAETASRG